ncbi:MAG: DUF6504 family protein [Anaerolineae bacterium]
MKIIYLFAPHLPVQVELQRRRATKEGLIIGGRPWDPSVVLDCCAKAEADGVVPGMSLARAALRCPEADFVTADHAAYQEAQECLDAALRQFTDRVETAGLGAFFLEVGQLARRFPEDKGRAEALLERAREASRLDLQIGLAEERFTAEQAALAARPNHAMVVPPRSGRSFLAPLPLNVLPAEAETLRRLALLGVHTLGELAALPRTALIRQFGPQAGFLHELAAGADPRPLHPDAPPLELRQRTPFEPPTADRHTLLATAQQTATALAKALDQHSYQAQGLRIEITDTSKGIHTTATSLEPPTADARRLSRRIQALVDACGRQHITRPVETLEIVIYPLRPAYLGATQLALFSASRDQRWQRLQEALRRLRARFGEFVVMVASLIKEPDPHPIQVTTDEDNVPLTFSWEERGKVIHRIYRVRQVYEHWRERRFWWSRPVARDYYRLEDTGGGVRLLYQDLSTGDWWLERR